MQRASQSLNELSSYGSLWADRNEKPVFKSSWSFSNLLESNEGLDLSEEKKRGSEDDLPVFVLRDRASGISLIERFQHKLATNVFVTLEKCANAEAGEKKTEELLEKLFYNISSRLEAKVGEKLKLSNHDTYYFELIASYYGNSDNKSTVEHRLLPICAQLWSCELFPAIFSLIMHRWLLKYDGPSKKGGTIRFNVLLKGTNQLFWFDTNHRSHRLLSVYCYTKGKLLQAVPQKSLQRDFKNLLCRFYYYYRSSKPEQVRKFLNELDISMDTFVCQNTNQLSAIEGNHKMRIHYLQCLSRLSCENFDQNNNGVIQGTTRNKLYSTLNALILPGAPFHPTIEERRKATETMNKLFPKGKRTRYAINLAFNVLRPVYWAGDLVTFVKESISAIFKFRLFGRSKEKDS